jgi:hypothetical protein
MLPLQRQLLPRLAKHHLYPTNPLPLWTSTAQRSRGKRPKPRRLKSEALPRMCQVARTQRSHERTRRPSNPPNRKRQRLRPGRFDLLPHRRKIPLPRCTNAPLLRHPHRLQTIGQASRLLDKLRTPSYITRPSHTHDQRAREPHPMVRARPPGQGFRCSEMLAEQPNHRPLDRLPEAPLQALHQPLSPPDCRQQQLLSLNP